MAPSPANCRPDGGQDTGRGSIGRRRSRPHDDTIVAIEPLTVAKVAVAGTIVGLLTGFFGVGGGFVIVPALDWNLLAGDRDELGCRPQHPAATGLDRLGNGRSLHPCQPLGVIVGSRLANTRDPTSLQRWFVALLVVVAIYTAARSGLALR